MKNKLLLQVVLLLVRLKKSITNEINEKKLIDTTVRIGFKNVIDAFHIVNGKPIPEPFFIDERKQNKGIRITENFHKLNELVDSENLPGEVEARWRLVETAWKIGVSSNLLEIKHDKEKEIFFAGSANNRINVTSSKNALNGYQKSKCFFCYDYISIITNSNSLGHADHFFPHKLKHNNFPGNLDGVWNLVLSCKECNNGKDGKFAKLPTIKLLERLNKRNEYFCSSHHPLKETIIGQTGRSADERKAFLQNSFNSAKNILIHTWEPKPKGLSTF